MEKHPYDELIETVADKMKEHKDDNLGFRIFENWIRIQVWDEEPHGIPVVGKTAAISVLGMFENEFKAPSVDHSGAVRVRKGRCDSNPMTFRWRLDFPYSH